MTSSPRVRLTERDHEILAFAAEHRIVLERQVEQLLGIGRRAARRRLAALVDNRYLTSDVLFSERYLQIQAPGLAAIGSTLPTPRLELGACKHDIGLAWLWLGARMGRFGPLEELVSERRMRSHDGAVDRPDDPYGVRLGGHDRYGSEVLHYPDLLLVDSHGRRLALELELSSKGRARRELILGGYARDRRIEHVLYLVEDHRAGYPVKRAIERTVHEMGLSGRVGFQLVKPFWTARDGRSRAGQQLAVRQPVEAAR